MSIDDPSMTHMDFISLRCPYWKKKCEQLKQPKKDRKKRKERRTVRKMVEKGRWKQRKIKSGEGC